MKHKYFEYITIEQKIIKGFLAKHPKLVKFVKHDEPFFVRIYKKPYAGLIHMIISQDDSNENVIQNWDKLLHNIKKITPKLMSEIDNSFFINIFGFKKAELINQITLDVLAKKLNLKELYKLSQREIFDILSKYRHLSPTTIQDFLIFGYFKKDVICDQDQDFISGLKIFLNKQNISQDDINNIKIEYKGEQTLFSLCMWKIKNESKR